MENELRSNAASAFNYEYARRMRDVLIIRLDVKDSAPFQPHDTLLPVLANVHVDDAVEDDENFGPSFTCQRYG